jgi:hypothetical protein
MESHSSVTLTLAARKFSANKKSILLDIRKK